MSKKWKRAAACLLALCLMAPVALAVHGHADQSAATTPPTSSWAQDEVQKADALGLIPGAIQGLETYRAPITRAQFCEMVVNFVARQQGSDLAPFEKLLTRYKVEYDDQGVVKAPFSDTAAEGVETMAYYLGIVNGKGDGKFDPDGLLTRQEAATMLARTYEACMGIYKAVPVLEGAPSYPDQAAISDWAKDAVTLMALWKVMNGMDDGTFAPQANYTVEQCILTLLRLWENAPTDPNAAPLFTYEQARAGLVKDGYDKVALDVKGTIADFLRVDVDLAVTLRPSHLYFVYHNGSVREVDLGVCNGPADTAPMVTTSLPIENAAFSADGKTFTCTVPVREGLTPAHAAGTYHVTVDVETLAYEAKLG